jgi:Rrf2 family protein
MAIGQFFSQRFGYGVHALAYIASKPTGTLTTLPELAEWMRTLWPGASETYLSQVVQRMGHGRLLRSHRGIAGGYSLARPANKITLRDVAELLDGVQIDRCTSLFGGASAVEKRSGIERRVSKPALLFLKSLERVSVADLTKDIEVPRRQKKRK